MPTNSRPGGMGGLPALVSRGRQAAPATRPTGVSVLGGGRSGSGGGSGSGSGAGPGLGRVGSVGIGLILTVIAVVWLLSGIYIIGEGTRGVVLRFGKYVDTTMPGPHWRIPYPVEQVEDRFFGVHLEVSSRLLAI